MRPIRGYKFSDIKKKALIADIRENGVRRGTACINIGITRKTFAMHIKADADFAESVEYAELDAIDRVEDSLWESAISGNVTAQIFFLKNRDPDRWEDVTRREMSGRDRGPIESEVVHKMDISGTPRERVEALIDDAERIIRDAAEGS